MDGLFSKPRFLAASTAAGQAGSRLELGLLEPNIVASMENQEPESSSPSQIINRVAAAPISKLPPMIVASDFYFQYSLRTKQSQNSVTVTFAFRLQNLNQTSRESKFYVSLRRLV